jgi:hypothetical protein
MEPTGQSDAVQAARFSPADTPAAVDGVEIAIFDGEAVLFHEATSMLHRLGAIAGGVWLYCDGETTVTSMINELASTFALDHDEVAAAVHETLERFADEGLLVGHDAPVRLAPTEEATRADDGTVILARPEDP